MGRRGNPEISSRRRWAQPGGQRRGGVVTPQPRRASLLTLLQGKYQKPLVPTAACGSQNGFPDRGGEQWLPRHGHHHQSLRDNAEQNRERQESCCLRSCSLQIYSISFTHVGVQRHPPPHTCCLLHSGCICSLEYSSSWGARGAPSVKCQTLDFS